MFIRVYNSGPSGGLQGGKEFLVNVNHISLVEVSYRSSGGWAVDLETGLGDPEASRVYHIRVGGEDFHLDSKENARGVKILSGIYDEAVKD